MTQKPILCLDFDGVIHSYTSGWKGADVIPDPPVPGALDFMIDAAEHFRVAVYSSRSGRPGGIKAMQKWLADALDDHHQEPTIDFHSIVRSQFEWPTEKPPAMVSIDDRAITFTGEWPDLDALKSFKPWNKS